nr:guanine nucleotide-binding protein G(s) subunit alpha-like [Dermatophagoides farinae]
MINCLSCPSETDPQMKESNKNDKKLKQWNRNESEVINMLLLGAGESGKTTIIKQMKILHIKGFSHEERLKKLQEIKQNVFESIKELTSNMEYLNPPIELVNPMNQPSLNFIKKLDTTQMETYDYPDEFFEHTKRLWSDPGIQACYLRSNEFFLIDSAKYFLDMIDKIRNPDYEPSDQDILRSRKRTSELQKIEFKVKVPKQNGGKMQPFCMYDVGGQRGERRKWFQAFIGIKAILFVVDSSSFDTKLREDGKTNRLKESIDLFKEVWSSSYLNKSGIILFMNKQDILKEKIQRGHRIENYFPEYKDYKLPKNKHEVEEEYEYRKARDFILDKFFQVTKDRNVCKHRFFSHFTTATDTNNIKFVFDDVHYCFMKENFDYII